MDPIAVSGLIAVILIGFWVLIVDTGGRIDQATIAERLAEIAPDPTRNEPDEVIRAGMPLQVSVGRLVATLREVRFLAKLEQTMWQAGVHLSLPSMLEMMLGLVAVGYLAGRFLAHDVTLAIVTGAALGLVPLFYVRWCAERRRQAFVRQLPAALDFVKSALEAGHPPLRALQVLANEFADPLGGEFRMVVEQAQLGMPLPRAFELLRRVAESDLRLLAIAIRVQSESGSSLAEVVGRLAEIVPARQRLQVQIRLMTAQSRSSAMIVALLPVVMLAIFAVIQPAYVHILFYDPTGVKVLKAAAVMDVLAFITIRRILAVNY